MDATVIVHETDTGDPTDTAELIDADIYEQLTQNINNFMAYPEQGHSAEIQSSTSAQPHSVTSQPMPPIHIDGGHHNLYLLTDLVADHFARDSAGVQVPGVPQGLSLYQTSQEALGASIWAPFRSQCDWEIARWAKMRGPTSSAVADLLAIPGVCAPHSHLPCC